MLRPAQLYAQLLQEENVKAWYKLENMYWNGGAGDDDISLPDNNYEKHCFVSVNSEDDILGYISYIPDWEEMSVRGVRIISYRKKSVEFARDVYTAICNIFDVYNMNRIEWKCYADNPAIRGYRRFIKRYGGRECGYYRQDTKLQDGKLHDSVAFEILAEEFRPGRKRQEMICEPKYLGENTAIGCRDGCCKCGNIVRSYQKFCDECGIKLDWGNVRG